MATPRAQVAAYLLGTGERPDLETLRRYRLSGFGYKQPADHHPGLRHDYLETVASHLKTRAQVVPLFEAWARAGVRFVLFKGLYLSGSVYPEPGFRRYGDVDVNVAQPDLRIAREVARACGWYEAWHRVDSLWEHKHEESVFQRDGVRLELHRLMVHASTADTRRQQELTDAWMEAAVPESLGQTTVLVPRPVDSALLLIVARCWSAEDHWRVRPTDYLDLKYLVERYGFTRRELESRARELRCDRTVRLFLDRCDPWRGVLDLDPPTQLQRHWWNLLVTPDHGNLTLRRMAMRSARSFGVVGDGLNELPTAWRVRRVLADRRAWHDDRLPAIAAGLCDARRPRKTGQVSNRDIDRVVRGVTAANLLLWRLDDPCLPRALGVWLSLVDRGLDPRLLLERDESTGEWHAGVVLTRPDPAGVTRVRALVGCEARARGAAGRRRWVECGPCPDASAHARGEGTATREAEGPRSS